MKKRDKIILFSSSYPFGLTETFLHNEILFLSDHFDIDIYPLIKKRNTDLPRMLPDNITYREPFLSRSFITRIVKGVFNSSPIVPFLQDFLLFLRTSKSKKRAFKQWFLYMITYRAIISDDRFKNILRESDHSIVYFYWGNFPFNLIRFPQRVFVRIHGGEVNFERHLGYIPFSDRKFGPKITFLPISEDATRKLYALNKNAISCISRLGVKYIGQNPDFSGETTLTIVSCSNIIPLKRVHLILRALKQVRSANVRWFHFGDGPLLSELMAEAQTLPENISVVFKGRLPNEEILNFYKNNYVDLFINVSETEGVPVSIMEALSFGIPCFATDAGGTKEILDQTGGKIVGVNFSLNELSDFIINIREYSKKHELRSGALKLWAEKCDAARNYSNLIKKIKRHNIINN